MFCYLSVLSFSDMAMTFDDLSSQLFPNCEGRAYCAGLAAQSGGMDRAAELRAQLAAVSQDLSVARA